MIEPLALPITPVSLALRSEQVQSYPHGMPLRAQARRTPWAGYWWPMKSGELVLGWDDKAGRRVWKPSEVRVFDQALAHPNGRGQRILDRYLRMRGVPLSPLMKFDLWVYARLLRDYERNRVPLGLLAHASRWELEHHHIGNDEAHQHAPSASFAGKCIGWALANFDYDEPVSGQIIDGVYFSPADIKGLLASLYCGAQFFIPDDCFIGNTYRNREGCDSKDFYEDVRPDDFVRSLARTIASGHLLEGDLDPGHEVWNHPIYRYDLLPSAIENNRCQVKAILGYVDDDVPIDGVFSIDPARRDLREMELHFELEFPPDESRLTHAISGRWLGSSIDAHPDTLILGIEDNWRTDIQAYKDGPMRHEFNFALIKRIRVGRRWCPLIDLLLEHYYLAQG